MLYIALLSQPLQLPKLELRLEMLPTIADLAAAGGSASRSAIADASKGKVLDWLLEGLVNSDSRVRREAARAIASLLRDADVAPRVLNREGSIRRILTWIAELDSAASIEAGRSAFASPDVSSTEHAGDHSGAGESSGAGNSASGGAKLSPKPSSVRLSSALLRYHPLIDALMDLLTEPPPLTQHSIQSRHPASLLRPDIEPLRGPDLVERAAEVDVRAALDVLTWGEPVEREESRRWWGWGGRRGSEGGKGVGERGGEGGRGVEDGGSGGMGIGLGGHAGTTIWGVMIDAANETMPRVCAPEAGVLAYRTRSVADERFIGERTRFESFDQARLPGTGQGGQGRKWDDAFSTPGLWDDLPGQSVAALLAAWAIDKWTATSAFNRQLIASMDSEGDALAVVAVAPEQMVRFHVARAIGRVAREQEMCLYGGKGDEKDGKGDGVLSKVGARVAGWKDAVVVRSQKIVSGRREMEERPGSERATIKEGKTKGDGMAAWGDGTVAGGTGAGATGAAASLFVTPAAIRSWSHALLSSASPPLSAFHHETAVLVEVLSAAVHMAHSASASSRSAAAALDSRGGDVAWGGKDRGGKGERGRANVGKEKEIGKGGTAAWRNGQVGRGAEIVGKQADGAVEGRQEGVDVEGGEVGSYKLGKEWTDVAVGVGLLWLSEMLMCAVRDKEAARQAVKTGRAGVGSGEVAGAAGRKGEGGRQGGGKSAESVGMTVATMKYLESLWRGRKGANGQGSPALPADQPTGAHPVKAPRNQALPGGDARGGDFPRKQLTDEQLHGGAGGASAGESAGEKSSWWSYVNPWGGSGVAGAAGQAVGVGSGSVQQGRERGVKGRGEQASGALGGEARGELGGALSEKHRAVRDEALRSASTAVVRLGVALGSEAWGWGVEGGGSGGVGERKSGTGEGNGGMVSGEREGCRVRSEEREVEGSVRVGMRGALGETGGDDSVPVVRDAGKASSRSSQAAAGGASAVSGAISRKDADATVNVTVDELLKVAEEEHEHLMDLLGFEGGLYSTRSGLVASNEDKPPASDEPPRVNVVEALDAAAAAVKALAELASEDWEMQEQLVAGGGVELMRRLLIGREYWEWVRGEEEVKRRDENGVLEKTPAPVLDVVFVHGMRGGPFKSWRRGEAVPAVAPPPGAPMATVAKTPVAGTPVAGASVEKTPVVLVPDEEPRIERRVGEGVRESEVVRVGEVVGEDERGGERMRQGGVEMESMMGGEIRREGVGRGGERDGGKEEGKSVGDTEASMLGRGGSVVEVEPSKLLEATLKEEEEGGKKGSCWPSASSLACVVILVCFLSMGRCLQELDCPRFLRLTSCLFPPHLLPQDISILLLHKLVAAGVGKRRVLSVSSLRRLRCPVFTLASPLLPTFLPQDISVLLLHKLVAAGVGERPVVFVTHSMGGLIVKQMLALARASDLPEIRALAERTTAIVFYSVPHFGSRIADYSWRARAVLRPAPSADCLRMSSPHVEGLNTMLRHMHKQGKIQVLSFAEVRGWGEGAV
ncbi:unnamed protein product [Closterium sp. Naga37s-1]|nr:unnamed protein product [Closterium sp. Naga37s-1]